jgi:hypothetical protein
MTTRLMTAKDALEAWDAGEPVGVFQVESEGSSQEDIYGFAFDLIRGKELTDAPATLSDREREVAYSIAKVALDKGWSAMVAHHIGPQIPAITIQKAK